MFPNFLQIFDYPLLNLLSTYLLFINGVTPFSSQTLSTIPILFPLSSDSHKLSISLPMIKFPPWYSIYCSCLPQDPGPSFAEIPNPSPYLPKHELLPHSLLTWLDPLLSKTRSLLSSSLFGGRSCCCLALCDPMDCSLPAPLSMGFPRQEWSGLPFSSPGDLPDPGIEPESSALQADSLPLSHLGSPSFSYHSSFLSLILPNF